MWLAGSESAEYWSVVIERETCPDLIIEYKAES